ncbi:energy transducer TonB [Zoogloea sp.]|uniref:energy transducer TonB n=1 Tax=Zoogloea sp. TaxID=49181 RepID=UPI002617F1B9|nr:energy transducer TonB [Zoogloea sp.]MDD3354461.1 energy transducer TonB [Zoogloea sp.]
MTAALTVPERPAFELPAPFQALPKAARSRSTRRNSLGVGMSILLHCGLVAGIVATVSQSSPPVTPPQPYMTVSLVSPAEEKPAPQPEPKPVRKPETKITPKVQSKSASPAPVRTLPTLTSTATANNPVEATAPTAPSSPPASAAPAKEAAVAVVAPRFDAAYLSNPAPEYPRISRKMGEEGRVMLKVQVGADGKPVDVIIFKSSGYPRLDEVARETVLNRWRFVPAKQGDQAVAGAVKVPIDFTLSS